MNRSLEVVLLATQASSLALVGLVGMKSEASEDE